MSTTKTIRSSVVLALAIPLGACPKPVVPPPPPVDRPSKEAETLIQDSLEAWATAHSLDSRGNDHFVLLQRAIAKARQADNVGGGRNGLAKTLEARLLFEANAAEGVAEAIRLATAGAAEDKGFAPAFLLLCELHLSRRQGEMTLEALALARRDLERAQAAIEWLQSGGRLNEEVIVSDDFYHAAMKAPDEMVERLRVIDRYLAFDIGNDGALPAAALAAAGGKGHSNQATTLITGVDTINRLKALHLLRKLDFDLARFDLEQQPDKVLTVALLKKQLEDLLGKLDPNCTEAKLEFLKVLLRLAESSPSKTEESWIQAFDYARTMLEHGGPMVGNDPRFRTYSFRIVCGYGTFRVKRFVEYEDVTKEMAEGSPSKGVHDSIAALTPTFVGESRRLKQVDPIVLSDLLAALIEYELTCTEFFAQFYRSQPAAKESYLKNSEICERWIDAFAELADDIPEAARAGVEGRIREYRNRLEAAVRLAKETGA